MTVTRRVSATVALLALAGAVALLLIGTIWNWSSVLISLLAVVIGVSAAWTVLSRHGTARAVALVIGAGSVGLLIWGFILADFQPLRIALVVAASAVSIGCAAVP